MGEVNSCRRREGDQNSEYAFWNNSRRKWWRIGKDANAFQNGNWGKNRERKTVDELDRTRRCCRRTKIRTQQFFSEWSSEFCGPQSRNERCVYQGPGPSIVPAHVLSNSEAWCTTRIRGNGRRAIIVEPARRTSSAERVWLPLSTPHSAWCTLAR